MNVPEPSRRKLETYLDERRNSNGLTVLRATTSSEEACLTNRVILMNNGECLACGSPSNLRTEYGVDHVTVEAANPADVRLNLRGVHDLAVDEDGLTLTFTARSGVQSAAGLLRMPIGGVRMVVVRQPSMWDVLERVVARIGDPNG